MKLGRIIHAAMIVVAAFLLVSSASASFITYNTSGSDTLLSCGTIGAACVQNSATSITVGGITLIYDTTSVTGNTLVPPSFTSLGAIDASGSGSDVSFAGATLSIGIDDTSLGVNGDMPVGTFSGVISTNSSSLSISFTSGFLVTTEGTLPGVALTNGTTTDVFQVLNTTEGIEPVSEGTTTLQGYVTQGVPGTVPEPATMAMVGGLFIGLGALARKRRKA